MNIALAWHVLIEDMLYGCWGVFGGPQDIRTATQAMPLGFNPRAGITFRAIGEAYDLLENEEVLDALLERAEETIKGVTVFLTNTSLTLDEIVKGTKQIRKAAYPAFLVKYYS